MSPFSLARRLLTFSLAVLGMHAPVRAEVITYEAFGAVGDGKTDDLPAIVKAHQHANEQGLPVRSRPDATYHLGTRALTAVIATDTDWNRSRFIIDDSRGVEDPQRSLFEVRSLLKPVPLSIKRLERGQSRLDLKPPADCLVYVENRKHRVFIRRGLNQNSGTPQKEVFILRRDGRIEGAIDWDYETITRVQAQPIDDSTLFLRGGVFTNIANRMKSSDRPNYWSRNIRIQRSRTVVEGVTHQVTGEGEDGHPYSGFLSVSQCARVVLRDCVIDGRKSYRKASNQGPPVSMGTYGYSANLVVDFRMIGCRMGNDIHDRSRWGVMGTNFMKHFLVEDCVLSRVDVHQGVSGTFTIRGSTLGHAGLNAIGSGRLLIEDSTIHGRRLVSFRPDYGSTWNGEVIIRNTRWLPQGGGKSDPVIFGMQNDGEHDFGYPCSMPRTVRIDGLFVDDSGGDKNYKGISIFTPPSRNPGNKAPFPYRLTERVEIRKLETTSGLPPRISDNEALNRAVKLVHTR
jgi:hypothetical protein